MCVCVCVCVCVCARRARHFCLENSSLIDPHFSSLGFRQENESKECIILVLSDVLLPVVFTVIYATYFSADPDF